MLYVFVNIDNDAKYFAKVDFLHSQNYDYFSSNYYCNAYSYGSM